MPNSSPRSSSRSTRPVSPRIGTPLLIALLLLPCGAALAQETTGAIEGIVTGPDGKPLVDVEVIATKPAPQVARKALTNRDGAYRITALPLGEYEVTIRDPRFEPATVRPVLVRLGQTTAVPPVKLVPLGELVEHVEVVGKAPPIDPVETTTGGNLAAKVFDNLPVQRDYQSVAMLLPNVNMSFLGDDINFGGATGYENRYFVDGTDMTDPEKGGGGTQLPPDFIQEVQVKTGGYQAEYRSALGGVVNVVTPSGSDQFAGKFIGYWTGQVVSQDPNQSPLAQQQKDLAQYDVGLSLSGPIVRDHAWFFVAYDPLYQTVDTEVPGIGYFEDSSITHRFAGKIDWHLDVSNSLVLTVIGDPTYRDGVGQGPWSALHATSLLNPDPYLSRIEQGGVAVAVRGTHVLGPRVLLESLLSRQSLVDRNVAATERGREEVLFVDAPTGEWSGGILAPYDAETTQWTAQLKASWALGRHQIKGGAEYRNTKYDYLSGKGGQVVRYSDTLFYDFYATRWQGSVQNRIPSLFVQDSWQIGPRFVLNYGLRWAREDFVSDAGDVVQTLNDEWQPRIGFVWEPGRIGSQRIYGSAGRYYQEVASYAVSYYYKGTGLQVFCFYDHDPRTDPTGGDCWEVSFAAQPEVEDLRGQSYDDYSLGYQWLFAGRHRAGVLATYRDFGDALDDGLVTATGTFIWGNPGRGPLAADYPRAERVYKALAFTVEGQPSARSGYLASYVLSENRGNYTGVYSQDFPWATPNYSSFDLPNHMATSGPLPNDRTHVFKASGFYRFESGLNLGASVLWMSGTPLNEFGGTPYGYSYYFLRPRGTAGRTPSIFDLSLRIDYTFLRKSSGRWRPRLILDIYHLFSGQEPVDYDQQHYLLEDSEGNQIAPNPTYGMVRQYYPPTTARLGFELSF